MNIIALICARGGSKGVPNKNIKLLAGKPLIVRSIDQIKELKEIDRIIVSTDSQEIANIAINAGAEVPPAASSYSSHQISLGSFLTGRLKKYQ